MSFDIKIARHIVRTDWMKAPEVERLFTVLQGQIPEDEPQALFVGGCVRNVLLGQEVEDLDIATPLPPDSVQEILEKEGVRVVPTGIEHGTVTAVLGERHFEITTLRHDVRTDGRRADVAFTESWEEDARRRDFTINTLLLDLKGNVYDPLGCALSDIDAKRVCFVGTPEKRIEEDYLRILRFFRFSARYADGYDADGLTACKKHSDQIKTLSKERITQEFFKIIAADSPYTVLQTMFDHDVLRAFKFSDYNPKFFEQFCVFQSRYGLNALAAKIFVMAALRFDNIRAMENYILFPKVFLRDMKAINGALTLSDLSCDHAVRESIYRYGRSITAQALMIELVQDRVMNGYAPQAIKVIQSWDVPMFPLSGHDLMEAGVEKGPALGKKLESIENWWIEQDFKPDHDACLKRI